MLPPGHVTRHSITRLEESVTNFSHAWAQRHSWSASVTVIDRHAPPTQTAQSVVLPELLDVDGCDIVGFLRRLEHTLFCYSCEIMIIIITPHKGWGKEGETRPRFSSAWFPRAGFRSFVWFVKCSWGGNFSETCKPWWWCYLPHSWTEARLKAFTSSC